MNEKPITEQLEEIKDTVSAIDKRLKEMEKEDKIEEENVAEAKFAIKVFAAMVLYIIIGIFSAAYHHTHNRADHETSLVAGTSWPIYWAWKAACKIVDPE